MAADQGTTIKVTVSFTDDASNAETLTSAATAAVSAAPNTPATGAPTITGTAQVGQTLTAGTTAIMDANGLTSVSYTYQWIRVATDNTETNIASATASTYTLVAADQGTTIKVTVSFTDDASNAETLTSAATATVSAAANTPPGAPGSLTATPGDGEVFLEWTAPADDGGSPVTSYEYRHAAGDGVPEDTPWQSAGLGLGWTVTGLTNGQQYAFEVRAVNSAGPGAPARTAATPLGMPSVPESLTATGGDGEVVLEWTEPADDGGSPVTGYEYRYAAGQAVPEDVTWRDAGTELTATVSGLENETRYTFEVRARNRVGPGETSGTTALPLRLRAELFSTAVLARKARRSWSGCAGAGGSRFRPTPTSA